MDGQYMPYDPNWQPSQGGDGQMIVLDPLTGREWDLWIVHYDQSTGIVNVGSGTLCAESYWTSYDGPLGARGCGIATYAMLPMAKEMAQGEIRHALGMSVPNPDGNIFVAPAHVLEHPGRGDGVPEGMRFGVTLTDQQIQNWLNAMPGGITAASKASAAKIARCLRDYGFLIVDTGSDYGRGGELDFEDYASGGAVWNTIGMNSYQAGSLYWPGQMLTGLVTNKSQVYAVVPSDQYP